MYKFAALIFLGCSAVAHGLGNLNSRIAGGSETTIDKHPYQVSVNYNDEHYCGASLISTQWILTAAHCVDGKKPGQIKVRIGSTYSNKGGKLIEISSIIIHEFYDDDNYDYDVAVIKLSTPVALNANVKPINLAMSSVAVTTGSLSVVTGWGKISATTNPMSDVLRVLAVPIFDQAKCLRIYVHHNTVTDNMLCAGGNAGKDTCQGDSGGPLVYNGSQIGIVSWGAGLCAKQGFPGVYTRISAVRTWITRRTGV